MRAPTLILEPSNFDCPKVGKSSLSLSYFLLFLHFLFTNRFPFCSFLPFHSFLFAFLFFFSFLISFPFHFLLIFSFLFAFSPPFGAHHSFDQRRKFPPLFLYHLCGHQISLFIPYFIIMTSSPTWLNVSHGILFPTHG